MPAFWSSKPKAPAINTQSLNPPNTNEDLSARAFSTTTQGTRSSEEGEGLPSGAVTPKPSGLDNRNPPISSLLQSPTPTPRQTHSAGNENYVHAPPPTPSTPTPVAPIGPPKGKLTVKILQARNLKLNKPDAAPYCVCVFENTEFISRGPVEDGSSNTTSTSTTTPPQGIAIPRSRQSSSTNLSTMGKLAGAVGLTRDDGRDSNRREKAIHAARNPHWRHEAVFDVLGIESELLVTVYDRQNQENFLGHLKICPKLVDKQVVEQWFRLDPRTPDETVTGEIKLYWIYESVERKHLGPNDFDIMRLIGRGTFGQVYQVRKKDTGRIYAMKVLSKKVIVQKKEVAHTIGERNILVRTATTSSPFIVSLKFSFQTPTDLYLVTDYMSGGELFWHLQREGKFPEQRAKFYIAELVLALENLHSKGIVYRDLKPENILLDVNGHVALCDFGLSKANLRESDTTNTFCGTTEYLAPEVLLDEQGMLQFRYKLKKGYTKLVDFWSLGVLVFEMCCGWSPFYAEDTQQMYKNIAFGKVRFPKDTLSAEGKSFVKGLLNRNPKHRLGAKDDARELKIHPFFEGIDWDALLRKEIPPPFKPVLKSESDVSNFDPEFTNVPAQKFEHQSNHSTSPLSSTVQENFRGFTFVDDSIINQHMRKLDLDKMDEDIEPHHRDSYDAVSETSIISDDDDDEDDEDMLVPGSSGRGQRMSGVEETMFEMR